MWNVLQLGSDSLNLKMNNDNPFRKRSDENIFKKKQRHKNIRIAQYIHQEMKVYAAINQTNIVELVDESLNHEVNDYGGRVTYEETSPIKISFEAHDKLKLLSSEYGVSITQIATEQLKHYINKK